mgnify:CR=1 FL=1
MSACDWFLRNLTAKAYHDKEWGFPVHDDRKMFEYLLMESMSCGLSWMLVLSKRNVFGECFANFDFNRVAKFSEDDVRRILETPGMIRSERKVRAIISNAKCFLKVRKEYGSFCDYLWSFTEGKSFVYRKLQNGVRETRNEISDKIATDLKKRGFKYLGSVILYSHLQGVGIFNAHSPDCPCYKKLLSKTRTEIR